MFAVFLFFFLGLYLSLLTFLPGSNLAGLGHVFDYCLMVCRAIYHVYRGADKSLARPDSKKQLKDRHFSSDAEVIAAAETWLDGQPSEFFF